MYDSATGMEHESLMDQKYEKYGARMFTTPDAPSEPQSKSDKIRSLVSHAKLEEAMSLAKTFKIWDDKADKEAVIIAHESRLNPAFYSAIGHDPKIAWDKGVEVLTRLYGEEK